VIATATATCRRQDLHTPGQPGGYLQWHRWATEMSATHFQRRCPGCGLFEIWEPKRRTGARPTGTGWPG
jgi:hypothetical protein